jgi:hypothetical protein
VGEPESQVLGIILVALGEVGGQGGQELFAPGSDGFGGKVDTVRCSRAKVWMRGWLTS